jgi:hypothetical protein
MATLPLTSAGCHLIDQAMTRIHGGYNFGQAPRLRVRPIPDPRPVLVPGVEGHVSVKIASQPEEWDQAFHLVAANYLEAGYQAPTGKPYRFTTYHALPDTTVFVAKRAGRVVVTFTLVADNSLLGLPLDALYAREMADLRRQGRRVGEITSLASAELSQRAFLQVFLALIRLLQQYHVHSGGDTWVITVNPRHRNFYCKVLGALQLGGCKSYAAVGDAPAEAYWVDQPTMQANAPRGHEQVFGEPLPPDAFHTVPLPRPFVRYFGAESSQTDEGQIDHILRHVAAVGTSRAW